MARRSIKWPPGLALGLVLLILSGRAAAPGPPLAMSAPRLAPQGESSNFTLEGKIIKAELGKFTVSTEENIIFHVRYDDKTDIKHQDGTAGLSKEIKVSARVKVEGDLTESGEIVAKKIEIEQNAKTPASLILLPKFKWYSLASHQGLTVNVTRRGHIPQRHTARFENGDVVASSIEEI